jgi:hypothetical protein
MAEDAGTNVLVSGGTGTGRVDHPIVGPSAADYAWAARELGDVPMRIVDTSPLFAHVDECAFWTIPTESLGREG